MTEADFQKLVESLPARQAQVYAELLERGPLVAKRTSSAKSPFDCIFDAGPSLARLGATGLARRLGREGGQTLWEAVTDPTQVEQVVAAFANRPGFNHGKRWLPSSDPSQPLGLRIAEFKRLSADKEVQAAILDSAGATRRQQSRLKAQMKRNAQAFRERSAERVAAQEAGEAVLNFIKLRNGLDLGVDHVRAINAMIEDEIQRIVETGEPQYSRERWRQLIPLLFDGVAKYERAYELVARITDSAPLPERGPTIEGEDIEDAELILEISQFGMDS